MSVKKISYHLAFLLSAVILFVVFNFLVCHPVQYVRTESKPTAWTTYSNTRYGFTVDIPANWEIMEDNFGIELYDPPSSRFISVKALPEISSMAYMPMEEYIFDYYRDRHPYLTDTSSELKSVVSAHNLRGCQIYPGINLSYSPETIQENWARKTFGRTATITCFPSQFAGDEFVSNIEIFTIGKPDSTYHRIVNSFGHKFKMLRQNELLSLGFIDSVETPHRSVAYLGEDLGYYIDLDGDRTDELLMICMPRSSPDEKEKIFLKVLKADDGKLKTVLFKEFSENSFHEPDLQIVNMDNKPGYDVFLRFYEYGNEWGKNSTVLVFYDGEKFRAAGFGPFAVVRDVDGNGVDEIITSTNTYFSLGAVSSWYDIYSFENGDFKERNLYYKKYFNDVILPEYQQQIEAVQSEMALSKIPSFQTAAFRLTYRIQKYIKWAKSIAEGKDIPYR